MTWILTHPKTADFSSLRVLQYLFVKNWFMKYTLYLIFLMYSHQAENYEHEYFSLMLQKENSRILLLQSLGDNQMISPNLSFNVKFKSVIRTQTRGYILALPLSSHIKLNLLLHLSKPQLLRLCHKNNNNFLTKKVIAKMN